MERKRGRDREKEGGREKGGRGKRRHLAKPIDKLDMNHAVYVC